MPRRDFVHPFVTAPTCCRKLHDPLEICLTSPILSPRPTMEAFPALQSGHVRTCAHGAQELGRCAVLVWVPRPYGPCHHTSSALLAAGISECWMRPPSDLRTLQHRASCGTSAMKQAAPAWPC